MKKWTVAYFKTEDEAKQVKEAIQPSRLLSTSSTSCFPKLPLTSLFLWELIYINKEAVLAEPDIFLADL